MTSNYSRTRLDHFVRIFGLLTCLVGCEDQAHCKTPGAVRIQGVCDCPIEAPYDRASDSCLSADGAAPRVTAESRPTDAGSRSNPGGRPPRPDGSPDVPEGDSNSPAGSRQSDSGPTMQRPERPGPSSSGNAESGPPGGSATDARETGASNSVKPTEPPLCDNGCGGPCDAPLAHSPGEPCSVGRGECIRSGVYECRGTTETVCNAREGAKSTESCDGKDNDCNGDIDDGAKNECGMACGAICAPKTPLCGDGMVDVGEECDDGNVNRTDACVSCKRARCGDGYVQAGVETCDPEQIGSSPYSCDPQSCNQRDLYVVCEPSINMECGGATGDGLCGYGYCSPPCRDGTAASCPKAAPTDSPVCIAGACLLGCTTAADCPGPGFTCIGTWCARGVR